MQIDHYIFWLTKHAVVLDLIQAGFNPLRLDIPHDKLKMIVTDVIESVIQDFHISIPMSAEAFIVPGMSSLRLLRAM